MKKWTALLLALVLMTAGCAVSADEAEFQLRNGIHFGDSLYEVKRKETLPMEDGSEDKTNNIWFKGTIAGMSGEVRYDFDENTGKLTDMLYAFSSTTDRDEVDSWYETLKKGLIRKYGDPLNNTGGSLHLITGEAYSHGFTLINLYEQLLDYTGSYRDYDEWIVDSGNDHVKIDLFCYYIRDKSYEYTYHIDLSYHYYTDQDYTDALLEKLLKNSQVDDDL